jgi:hypothetical protein
MSSTEHCKICSNFDECPVLGIFSITECTEFWMMLMSGNSNGNFWTKLENYSGDDFL